MSKPVLVLAVDDEASILSALQRSFLREPFGFVGTTSVDEAWGVLASAGIKVLISDQRMPGLSGVQFLRQVRDAYPDVLRILLTGYSDMQAAEEAVNVGQVYRFMTKPWNVEDLRSTIRKAIERYDLQVLNRRLFEELRVVNARLLSANMELQGMHDKQREFAAEMTRGLTISLALIRKDMDLVLSAASGSVTEDQRDALGRAKDAVDRLTRDIAGLAGSGAGGPGFAADSKNVP